MTPPITPITLKPVHFALLQALILADDAEGVPAKSLRQVVLPGTNYKTPATDELGELLSARLVDVLLDPVTGQPPVDDEGVPRRIYCLSDESRKRLRPMYAQQSIPFPVAPVAPVAPIAAVAPGDKPVMRAAAAAR